jgi:hypothetical protein
MTTLEQLRRRLGALLNRPGQGGEATAASTGKRAVTLLRTHTGRVAGKATGVTGTGRGSGRSARTARAEEQLRQTLRDDPNDVVAFAELAEVVRAAAAVGHEVEDPRRAADDAVWALAEELAHSPRAWYPLVEMARLSIEHDRESAMRRLGTAAERDHSGQALVMGIDMLRETGHTGDALNLGVGHWRPHEHAPEAARAMVEAALAAGRPSEARRLLTAIADHPDERAAQAVTRRMERALADAAPPAAPRRTPSP